VCTPFPFITLAAALLATVPLHAVETGNIDPALESFVKSYKARGVMNDASQPLDPQAALDASDKHLPLLEWWALALSSSP
jgi:hypothetical protein